MIEMTSGSLFAALVIFFMFGLLGGMCLQRYNDRDLRAKLKVAETTLIQQRGRLNQLQQYKDNVMKEFAEGKWEAT